MMGKLGGRNRWRAISQWNAYYTPSIRDFWVAFVVAKLDYESGR